MSEAKTQAEFPFDIFEEEMINPLNGIDLTENEEFVANLLLDATSEKPIKMAEIIVEALHKKTITLTDRMVRDRAFASPESRLSDLHPKGQPGRILLGPIGSGTGGICRRLDGSIQRRGPDPAHHPQTQLPASRRPDAAQFRNGGINDKGIFPVRGLVFMDSWLFVPVDGFPL